ncbi:MAG: hypothetical protein LQ340_005673 [Diploschistes diacapsis]|nr:MAG: hypothetical protein LQ340_005673 [Diploschistes diacapsis]
MSDSEDERPSFGGGGIEAGFTSGLNLGRRKFDDSEDSEGEEQPSKKVKFNQFRQTKPVMARNGAAPAVSKPGSFAARMMAQMGYKEGLGLGKEGRGRLAPIETQLRPQNAGLGAVKEKTKQAKQEEKREAEFRGEVIEDSSEEERKKKKERRAQRLAWRGTSTLKPRPKIKYRTATEIEQDAGGLLQVPDTLKSLIDVTGKETQLLSATGFLVPSETEEVKIAKRAHRELEAFVDEWSALQDRKRYYELEFSHTLTESDNQEIEMEDLRKALEDVQQLQQLGVQSSDSPSWDAIIKRMENMEVLLKDTKGDVKSTLNLEEIAVSTIHPMFRQAMHTWEPLEEPTYLVSYLESMKHVLAIQSGAEDTALIVQNREYSSRRDRKTTSFYETMIYTLWLPPVRNAIVNTWNVEDPIPLSTLIDTWQPLLPPFVLSNIIDQLLLPRLSVALSEWKPRRSSKSQRRSHSQPPHIWLFPWLQYLPPHHLDPTASSGLIASAKRKLRSILSSYDITHGPPPWLPPWQPLLKSTYSTLLTSHLLPRLANFLSQNLVIDPSDQDLIPLTTVFAYLPLFKPDTFAHLLTAHFFPKFHSVLHQWLTDEAASYDEIGQWFQWWKEQIPASIRDLPPVQAEWNRVIETMALALDLGDRVATELPAPLPPPSDISLATAEGTKLPTLATTDLPAAAGGRASLEQSFKDIVEGWCEEEGLLLIPLRQAHETTGLPLSRLTASATGKGGLLVFIKGDVLFIREKKGGQELWEPKELGEALVRMAGG